MAFWQNPPLSFIPSFPAFPLVSLPLLPSPSPRFPFPFLFRSRYATRVRESHRGAGLGFVTVGLCESVCKFVFSCPLQLEGRAQICTLIHPNLESQIPSLERSHWDVSSRHFWSICVLQGCTTGLLTLQTCDFRNPSIRSTSASPRFMRWFHTTALSSQPHLLCCLIKRRRNGM